MIFQMSLDIAVTLAARKFPFNVIYAPESTERKGYINAITIERDRSGGDKVVGNQANKQNPKAEAIRLLGVVARVYAVSQLDGSMINNHENLCDQVVDALVIEVLKWGTAAKVGRPTFTSSRYLTAEERNTEETWPGVVYELRFAMPRGIRDITFEKEARSESGSNITGASNVTQVEGPEGIDATGCGA